MRDPTKSSTRPMGIGIGHIDLELQRSPQNGCDAHCPDWFVTVSPGNQVHLVGVQGPINGREMSLMAK